MSRRLSDKIAAWVEEALDTYLLGDNAQYDVAVMMDPQHGPLLLVTLWMPSLVVGEQLQSVGAMPNPGSITVEQVDGFVAQALEAMRNERSKPSQAPQSGLLVAGR